jgi:hypothetical protein
MDESLANLVHAICTCYGQWPPGDERGFRSRDHRIHSSGDYRNPPPPGEHEGLRRHAQAVMRVSPITLDPRQREIVGAAFVCKLILMKCRPMVVACSATHLHSLHFSMEADALRELGKPKQFASLKLAAPGGKLWAEGGKIVRVETLTHRDNAFEYILKHAEKEDAWVWRHDRDAPIRREDLGRLLIDYGSRT